MSAKPNSNTLINRNQSNYNTKLFDNGWCLNELMTKNEMQILDILLKSIANESYIFTKIILTEFNQRVRYAIFKSIFGIF
ncbi:hypothetical protein VN0352_01700 [Helicobacter pylori]|nr:hypothetical protein VN0352_01700 [Helicobacter pylori]